MKRLEFVSVNGLLENRRLENRANVLSEFTWHLGLSAHAHRRGCASLGARDLRLAAPAYAEPPLLKQAIGGRKPTPNPA